MKRMLIAAVAALLVAGCATATVGKPFNAANVGQLQEGVSSITEARSLLGEPWQVQTTGTGEHLYIWQYIRSDAKSALVTVSVDTTTQQAALVFGADGKLLRAANLINVPAPKPASVVKPVNWNPAPTRGNEKATGSSKEQQLQELQNTPGLSYEEYQRRYNAILGQ